MTIEKVRNELQHTSYSDRTEKGLRNYADLLSLVGIEWITSKHVPIVEELVDYLGNNKRNLLNIGFFMESPFVLSYGSQIRTGARLLTAKEVQNYLIYLSNDNTYQPYIYKDQLT